MNNVFQRTEFYDFIQKLPFLEPFRFEVKRDGEVKASVIGFIQKDGGTLKRFFSRRAIINGGPFIADDATEEDVITLMKRCAKGLKGRAIYVETRNFEDYSPWKEAFAKAGFKYEPHYNFHVDTTSEETAEGNLGKSRKRDIRTSLRDGAAIVEQPTDAQILDYYSLLQDLYKKKVKTPLFPFIFFRQLVSSSMGKIILISLEGKIIGGTTLLCGKNCVYEWFVCGEDGVYKNIFPSTLATWSGIKFAAQNGYQRFDMMGAGAPGDGGYGVRDFKAKFGGTLVEHGRFRCVLSPLLYQIGALAVKIIKKIK